MTKMICGLVPSTMATGCTDFMRIYSRALLQMVLTEYTAPEFCAAVHMCKEDDGEEFLCICRTVHCQVSRRFEALHRIAYPTIIQFCNLYQIKTEFFIVRKFNQLSANEKSAAVCEACQVLSQYLSFEFQQPDFQQEVVQTLKGACGLLPGDYKLQVREIRICITLYGIQ